MQEDNVPDMAELVNNLFRDHRKPDGKEYSNQEVARGVDGRIDPTYIGKIRNGLIKNPSRDTLKQLCIFFRIPSNYFFPELETINSDEDTQSPKEKVRNALRGVIPPEAQVPIEAIIDLFIKDKKKDKGD